MFVFFLVLLLYRIIMYFYRSAVNKICSKIVGPRNGRLCVTGWDVKPSPCSILPDLGGMQKQNAGAISGDMQINRRLAGCVISSSRSRQRQRKEVLLLLGCGDTPASAGISWWRCCRTECLTYRVPLSEVIAAARSRQSATALNALLDLSV